VSGIILVFSIGMMFVLASAGISMVDLLLNDTIFPQCHQWQATKPRSNMSVLIFLVSRLLPYQINVTVCGKENVLNFQMEFKSLRNA